MISSYKDMIFYYTEDLRATGLNLHPSFIEFIRDRRYRFYKLLRKTEYYTNCKKNYIGCKYAAYLRMKYRWLCDKYNWTIPINVVGYGLQIVHAGPIVISGSAKIGNYARIHICVNVGRAYAKGVDGAPSIGNRVYFGPGAKIFGGITIGDNVVIGANAVVNDSFESNCTVAGVPAKVISNKSSLIYINC